MRENQGKFGDMEIFSFCVCVCVCVCVCGTRLSTCTAGTLPSEPNLQSILLGYFGDGVLQTICQLVLNCNFPDLSHSNSWDYRCQFLMPG
jgi:hypothetical protein